MLKHSESHRSHRSGWLRAVVLGAILLASAMTSAFTWAKGLNCAVAKSSIDLLICKTPNVLALDQTLSDAYNALLTAQPQDKSTFKQAQKAWLLERNKCDNADCLEQAYTSRIKSVLRLASAHKPNALDQRALNELKQTLLAQLKFDKEFPLEKTLKQLEIKNGFTDFSNVVEEGNTDSMAHLPKARPAGVTEDEWKAILKSKIDAGGENGTASYMLLDMNGDGKRDLMLDSYTGGTGLFSEISALKRKKDLFVGAYSTINSQTDSEDAAIYTLMGRGSNQHATWIKLQNQVYVAYVDSEYGMDTVSILRPLEINNSVGTLSIQYEYELTVPKKQMSEGKPAGILDDQLYASLNKSLSMVNKRQTQHNRNGTEKPICPIPPKATKDERAQYFSRGPVHYQIELISNFPVWLGKACHVGQLVGWFGAYDEKNGLSALLLMSEPTEAEVSPKEFQVVGKRYMVDVRTSLSKFGDNR